MTDMREAVAKSICAANEHTDHSNWRMYLDEADAALSLMQPEIDRRVAEERAKLLERLREPGWGLVETVMDCGPIGCCIIGETEAKAILVSIAEAITQFEKENNHED